MASTMDEFSLAGTEGGEEGSGKSTCVCVLWTLWSCSRDSCVCGEVPRVWLNTLGACP